MQKKIESENPLLLMLTKAGVPITEKSLRILSLEAEKKNEAICDYSFNAEKAVEDIKNLIRNV